MQHELKADGARPITRLLKQCIVLFEQNVSRITNTVPGRNYQNNHDFCKKEGLRVMSLQYLRLLVAAGTVASPPSGERPQPPNPSSR
jgi:hypothetical protein